MTAATAGRLNLFDTRVGDAGLMNLRDLPRLKNVDMAKTDVTAAGLVEFKKIRTNVNVNLVQRAATPRKSATAKKAAAPAGR